MIFSKAEVICVFRFWYFRWLATVVVLIVVILKAVFPQNGKNVRDTSSFEGKYVIIGCECNKRIPLKAASKSGIAKLYAN